MLARTEPLDLGRAAGGLATCAFFELFRSGGSLTLQGLTEKLVENGAFGYFLTVALRQLSSPLRGQVLEREDGCWELTGEGWEFLLAVGLKLGDQCDPKQLIDPDY